MLTASVCFFIGYLPELYANWKNKNANIYNLPERVLLLIGTFFAFSYSIVTNNQALIINYTPILCLDATVLLMRLYYWRMNNKLARIVDVDTIEPQEDIECNSSVLIVEEQDTIQP